MGIIYITCFFVSIFILLNLALSIYNKFREGFECENKPVGFTLNPNDKKNKEYLSETFGKPENDPTKLLDGDGKQLVNNGISLTIGNVLGADAPTPKQYSCNDLKEYTESVPKWRKDEYTIDNQIIYPFEFQKAISTGCKKTLCDSLTDDNNIKNFGMNKKQQQDIYGINEILKNNHGSVEVTTGLSNIWRLDEGTFSVHGEDTTDGNTWQPNITDDSKFFSQTSDGTKKFKGIIDGKDKLLAWTNDSDKSKLFTCKKPCDGKQNIWKYDEKTITSGDQDNINYYNIKDMTSDETFNWMIHSYKDKNYIEKKLNDGTDYLNHTNIDYKNYFTPDEGNDKFIEPARGDIYWKTINIDRRVNKNYKPIQITNNKKYVIILSHSDDTTKNGIYICNKPCTGEIYNWHKILDDERKDITLIRGDFSDNILWYINKQGELWKLTIPDIIPSEQTMFTPGYDRKQTDAETLTKTNKLRYKFSNPNNNKQVKLVYGGDKDYLWVILDGDKNLHGVDRRWSSPSPPVTISKTITNSRTITNFIVEEHKNNKPQQQKCSDGFSSDGNLNEKESCKELTNNESSTVNENKYCNQPSCKKSDFRQCCTFNQKCSEKKNDPLTGGDFCNIDGMSGFKDSLTDLYCAGPECKKTYPDTNNKPHEDVFVCCKPTNLPDKLGVCNAVKDSGGGMTYGNNSYSSLYNTKITDELVKPWEKSKYLNLMDYATKAWKKNPSGGKYRESFKLNDEGKIMLGKTQAPIIGSWDTISTPIQTKLSNLSNNTNINLNGQEKTTFLKQLLKQSGEHAYDNLNDKFKTKKTCSEWNVCPVGAGKKHTLKPNTYSFFDGEQSDGTDGLKLDLINDDTINFCCKCGQGKYDNGVECAEWTKKEADCSGNKADGSGRKKFKEGDTKTDSSCEAFSNMEGFSGFTREDWAAGKTFMESSTATFQGDSDKTQKFLAGLRTAKNHDESTIPCTKNFSQGGFSDDDWKYQKPDDDNKYCPPFQPTCVESICTGNLDPPKLETPDHKTLLRVITDKDLRDASYCTGVFSTCDAGGVCTLNNPATQPWSNYKYDDIVTNSISENEPPDPHIGVGRKSSDPKCDPECGWGKRCVAIVGGFECITETSTYAPGNDNINSTKRFSDGVSLLSSEEIRIRGLTADEKDKQELKENNANFLEEGSLKKWNLTEGGSKSSEIKSNSFRKSIDVLKTKYIWSFNIPPSVINSLIRLRNLDKINLGLKNFLLETRERPDFKKAITKDKDILISYNRRAIVTALYKLSQKKQTRVGEKKWSKIINDKWIHERSFKTKDTCSGGVCSGNLTLKDLDTSKIPWGYKSRNAFKKKTPGTTDSWNKLGDTSDVGKHLYGNTPVRNIFNQVNPHPNDNPTIL